MNKVILIGRLGADPEITSTQNGTKVANLRLATNESWKDKAGAQQERTEWHRVVVFGKLAELCGSYLSKGRQVCVEGSLRTRKWEDKDGQTRSTTEIVASSVHFLGSGSGGSQKEEGLPDGVQVGEHDDDGPTLPEE